MLSKKMEKALNDQIAAEFYASFLYLSMSTHFEAVNLSGFAHWMRLQATEEYGHAMKIYRHILERQGRVIIQPVAEVPSEWDSPLAAFQAAQQHEEKVTGMIDTLVTQAREEKDYATESFLKWFVDEQVEEEEQVGTIVEQIKMVTDSVGALFMLDRALAARE